MKRVTSLLLNKGRIEPSSIVLFGDSITERSFIKRGNNVGWGIYVANEYNRRADVFNRGFRSYNTDWGLRLMPHIFRRDSFPNIKLVTVCFGANDASISERNPFQHVPLTRYQNNLQRILSFLEGYSVNTVLITPPPVDDQAYSETQRKWRDPPEEENIPWRSNANAGLYAMVCKEVALDVGVPCIDIWTRMQNAAPSDWNIFLEDGLHLSPSGNRFLFNALISTLRDHFPHILPENLPPLFPDPKSLGCDGFVSALKEITK